MHNTGIYLRLSREDADGGGESQSISNQRAFLIDYAEAHKFQVVETYIDDGYSGTTFERPGFLRLLEDIEKGRIDLVLTKDLSRLGRDYIQTGHFLERYFPERHVRYIAVNDGIDTGKNDGDMGMTPFLSVLNDFYARDISRKVRTALTTKKRCGVFIGANPPYGYEKDPKAHGHLLPDQNTAPVVKEIFEVYMGSASVLATAKWLTSQGIPTPSGRAGQGWSDSMVRRMLTNPTYAGHITQNRSRTISYKVNKRVRLPREDWITVEHTHEALVSQALFDQVQQLLQIHRHRVNRPGSPHMLSGIAVCGDCGGAMTFVRESETRIYLVCGASRTPNPPGQPKRCTSHCFRESAAEKAISAVLRCLIFGGLEQGECIWEKVDIEKLIPMTINSLRIYKNKVVELVLRLSDSCIRRGGL